MNLVFETPRLRLKPIAESQLQLLYNIITNPYVRKYLCDNTTWSMQQVQELLTENEKLFRQENLGLWFIETKEKQETIGFTGLWYYFSEKQPQLVYALLPEATKKGYATEAATQILRYCFDELNYQYLVVSCDSINLESKKLAERIGMKEVEERVIDGSPILFFHLHRLQFYSDRVS